MRKCYYSVGGKAVVALVSEELALGVGAAGAVEMATLRTGVLERAARACPGAAERSKSCSSLPGSRSNAPNDIQENNWTISCKKKLKYTQC